MDLLHERGNASGAALLHKVTCPLFVHRSRTWSGFAAHNYPGEFPFRISNVFSVIKSTSQGVDIHVAREINSRFDIPK